MGYQGGGDTDHREPSDATARAALYRLCRRFGCVGGEYWLIEKKAPLSITIRAMGGDETWELDGQQTGVNYRDKLYRRTK